MDIGGTITGRNRYDPMDAYTEVGGRATQDAKAEGIESQAGSGRPRATQDDHMEVGGRILPGYSQGREW